jgi:hypothetical protein
MIQDPIVAYDLRLVLQIPQASDFATSPQLLLSKEKMPPPKGRKGEGSEPPTYGKTLGEIAIAFLQAYQMLMSQNGDRGQGSDGGSPLGADDGNSKQIPIPPWPTNIMGPDHKTMCEQILSMPTHPSWHRRVEH